MRRATGTSDKGNRSLQNFYLRPPRGGRPGSARRRSRSRNFYPRPPRGGRQVCAALFYEFVNISIHALREEGDPHPGLAAQDDAGFLSTPSARRATLFLARGGSRREISIHALREEGDPPAVTMRMRFLSTPSARRATAVLAERLNHGCISIHAPREEGDDGGRHLRPCQLISIRALREEGDQPRCIRHWRLHHFYPRPPRGGRPDKAAEVLPSVLFLSTPSARRATISGSDGNLGDKFLSTPSARRATRREPDVGGHHAISIHALREEGDDDTGKKELVLEISIHALREEGDVVAVVVGTVEK